jgi:phosphatidylinositol alpha-mannosyltransferase
MKIGLVTSYNYSFPGGVVKHISYLAHYFTRWGHKVKIIAPCLEKGTHYFGEEVTPVGRPLPVPFGGSVARIPLSPWLPAQIHKILNQEKFDVIHLHEPFTPMLCVSMLLLSNCVNVGTFHACYNKPRTYWIFKPLLTRWVPRLHGKIAVSQAALDYASHHLPGDYRIIPNGIDIERFSANGSKPKYLADDKMNILFVGRLEKRKGLSYLISACAKVKQSFPYFRLTVVGPGTRLRGGYEEQVKDLGLYENVVFTDFVPDEELPEYYRSADIFCSPATGGESFGIVLLEAMASGKPVVASNIGGYASVLAHGEDGLLVPPKDDDALAQSLLTLIKDESLRNAMGSKGRIEAEKYSWENVARQVMDFYEDLLSQHREDKHYE